jgi:uncharacterized protein YggU (UPF0235/DUF167 family)
MKILVKVRSRARVDKVEQLTQPTLGLGNGEREILVYRVSVKEPPVDGKANEAIRLLLANHFSVPAYAVKIITGQTSKQKLFEIEGMHS